MAWWGYGAVQATTPYGAFTVDMPEGFRLLAEGRGSNPISWDDDSVASTGGFVVLAQSDTADDPDDLTVVELTGYEGFQGELRQTSHDYPRAPGADREIGGQPAIVFDLGEATQVVAVRRDNLAVSVHSSQMDEEQMVDLILATELPDGPAPTGAPDVEPPDGWVVLGRATSDWTVALDAFSYDGYTGGPTTALSSAWHSPDRAQIITVLTLPPSVGDIEAALGHPLTSSGTAALEADRFELDGRDAVWTLSDRGRAMVVTTTDTGALLVVRAAPDDGPPADRDLLEQIATSVEMI